MRILFLNTFYAPDAKGGAEIILQEQVNGLKALGHQVAVLCIGRDDGLHETVVDGVTVYRAGLRNLYYPGSDSDRPPMHRFLWHLLDMYNPLMAAVLRRVIAAERPDVVSCHNLSGWSVAVWRAIAECDVPVVQVLHDHYLLCPKSTMFDGQRPCGVQCRLCRLMRFGHQTFSSRVDAVVGVSQYILDRLCHHGYFHDVRVREAIHNVREMAEVPVREHGSRKRDGRVVFGFIGALVPSKGIELLLREFADTAPPEWRLHVAGAGSLSYESSLKERFRDPRISFLGRCTPQEFFPSVDICVVPSLGEEALGMVVLEALLSGVPVIGSCRGGIPEMLRHGENGLLIDPGKEGELAAAMAGMAGSIDSWRMKRAGLRQSAMPFADRLQWLKKWEKLYENVA